MLKLEAEKRELFGKQLESSRKEGKLPAVLYGGKEENTPLFVNLKDFRKVWSEAGESALIDLGVGGKAVSVLVQDIGWDPVKDIPVHVDFLAVEMDKEITATVPLVFAGTAPAIKEMGGVLVKVMHEVEVEALPKSLPHELEVDISSLVDFESQITIGGLKLPEGVKATAKEEEVVALVSAPREETVEDAETSSIEDIEVEKKGKAEKETTEGATEEK